MSAPHLNAIYSVFSYGMKRYAGFSVMPPLPPAINVELSSRCNLSCPECVTGAGLLKRGRAFIDTKIAEKIAGELSGRTLSAWLYFQGEPMMHPEFFQIVSLFRNMNPVISTNGHFLNEENCRMLADSPLKRIIISYDGATAVTYNIYRTGGDHTRVTEGIRSLADTIRKRGSGVKIELQLLLGKYNEHEKRVVAEFAASVNADFRIKSMQVLDIERAGDWMPSDTARSRYRKSKGNWEPASSKTRGCLRMWTSAIVTTDGDVVPCCFDKFAVHSMGNLTDQTFSAIWHGEKYSAFRNSVIRSRASTDICSGCPQGRRILFKS
ncbi:MAG: radical SAM/SPASM domain-containing protein [Bacteroidales bacterium]